MKYDKTRIVTQLENSNYDNSKTQIVTKLKKKLKLRQNLKYDKYQFMKTNKFKGSFRKNILTP